MSTDKSTGKFLPIFTKFSDKFRSSKSSAKSSEMLVNLGQRDVEGNVSGEASSPGVSESHAGSFLNPNDFPTVSSIYSSYQVSVSSSIGSISAAAPSIYSQSGLAGTFSPFAITTSTTSYGTVSSTLTNMTTNVTQQSHLSKFNTPNYNQIKTPAGHSSWPIQTNLMPNVQPSFQSTPNRYQTNLGSTAHALRKVALPDFWPQDVKLWLASIEAIFENHLIFGEHERFNLTISALKQPQITKIGHAILNRSTDTPYISLKIALLKQYQDNDIRRLDKLLHETQLGSCRPSELMNKMKQLLIDGGEQNSTTEKVLKKLFLERMPENFRLVLAADYDLGLDALADKADKIMMIGNPTNLPLAPVVNPALAQTKTDTGLVNSQTLINNNFQLQLSKIAEDLGALRTLHTSQSNQKQHNNVSNQRREGYNNRSYNNYNSYRRGNSFSPPNNRQQPWLSRPPYRNERSWDHNDPPRRYASQTYGASSTRFEQPNYLSKNAPGLSRR